MRRSFSLSLSLSCFALVAIAAAAGCSGANGSGGGSGGGDGGGGQDGGGSTAPHALGTILLGESHAPAGGTSTPAVLASFIPDASALPATCATQVDGCTFVTTPQCGTSGTTCGADQACAWDSACNATCVSACTLQCGTGQECYFAAPGSPACRNTETFDAGALTFVGTTAPLTLFPPYQYTATPGASPFLSGAQIEVQASGATAAGFNEFDEKFTATSLLQTNPPLDTIPTATVFGTGTIPVGWAPGSDTIDITVTGLAGTATCTATDSTGSFQIPRDVVNAAMGTGGSSELQITVTRERDDWHKDQSTRGSLTTATVQPVGWLELTTESSESASFQGCSVPGETMCPDGCFDTQSDQYHCGSCTVVCGANDACVAGQCTGGSTTDCTTCEQSAQTSTCATQTSTCESDSQCSSFASCSQACTAGDTTCQSTCESEYPTGYSDYLDYKDCVCFTACATQCAAACAD